MAIGPGHQSLGAERTQVALERSTDEARREKTPGRRKQGRGIQARQAAEESKALLEDGGSSEAGGPTYNLSFPRRGCAIS
mmetsp:Transcript_5774/g.11860  ORF Transcript_5774/g.11860 Transcript_5774/m.11860 type:complete len:80 (+) Transcript_5774:564-803(+)